MQMKVISVSRRTDVPAFYAKWLINRIQAGFVHWINPFSHKVYRVSLKPKDCIALVFWTRNPKPLMPYLEELNKRGYKYYFLYSILGYPKLIETHNPDLETSIRTFQSLAETIGQDLVFWRYDPIVLSSITPLQFHIDRFRYIAEKLTGYTNRCIYSFLDMYGKTKRNLTRVTKESGIIFEDPVRGRRNKLMSEIVNIARSCNMELQSCCEDDYLFVKGIKKGGCVDNEILNRLTNNSYLRLKNKPTREHCGCVESVDIGSYNTCLFGCSYCYATTSKKTAYEHYTRHDPNDTILYRPERLSGIDLDSLIKDKG